MWCGLGRNQQRKLKADIWKKSNSKDDEALDQISCEGCRASVFCGL